MLVLCGERLKEEKLERQKIKQEEADKDDQNRREFAEMMASARDSAKNSPAPKGMSIQFRSKEAVAVRGPFQTRSTVGAFLVCVYQRNCVVAWFSLVGVRACMR